MGGVARDDELRETAPWPDFTWSADHGCTNLQVSVQVGGFRHERRQRQVVVRKPERGMCAGDRGRVWDGRGKCHRGWRGCVWETWSTDLRRACLSQITWLETRIGPNATCNPSTCTHLPTPHLTMQWTKNLCDRRVGDGHLVAWSALSWRALLPHDEPSGSGVARWSSRKIDCVTSAKSSLPSQDDSTLTTPSPIFTHKDHLVNGLGVLWTVRETSLPSPHPLSRYFLVAANLRAFPLSPAAYSSRTPAPTPQQNNPCTHHSYQTTGVCVLCR